MRARAPHSQWRDRASFSQAADKGPSASLAPSAARSTYREYASRAALRAPPRRWTLLHGLPALSHSDALRGPPIKAHRLLWRPRPHAQRTESTTVARASRAPSQLDLSQGPVRLFGLVIGLTGFAVS